KASEKNFSSPQLFFNLGILARAYGENELAEEQLKRYLETPDSLKDPIKQNRAKNELEIAQGKIQIKTHPEILYVTLTNKCNANCLVCCVEKTPPWEIREEVLNEIKSLFPYLKRIFWLGGEVFFYKNFKRVFAQAIKYPQMKQVILTNGLLLDKEWADLFSQSNLHLVYSIDSIIPEVYEKIRRGSSYKKLLENIQLVKDAEIRNTEFSTGMTFILMKSNYTELPLLADFALEKGFKTLTINEVRGEFQEKIDFKKDKEVASFVKKHLPELIDKCLKFGIELNNEMAIGLDTPEEKILPLEEEKSCEKEKLKGPYCLYPWKSITMDVFGKTIPWFYCSQELGNTDEKFLKEIWNGETMQKYRENILKNNSNYLCPQNCVAINKENIFSALL
ncbi:MAG: radical SAM protein, partial [Elusimicrobia bacterium]|nr:radical SAM protein [Elusimicrobiota bacterium]